MSARLSTRMSGRQRGSSEVNRRARSASAETAALAAEGLVLARRRWGEVKKLATRVAIAARRALASACQLASRSARAVRAREQLVVRRLAAPRCVEVPRLERPRGDLEGVDDLLRGVLVLERRR